MRPIDERSRTQSGASIPDPAPAVTAIVLAAGLSRRAAPQHKLLLPAPDGSGRVVVRATVEAICGGGFADVIIVTGHECARIEAALDGLPVRCVFATDFAGGMGNSLAAGVRAARTETLGFAVVPGDLPELTSPLVRTIVACFASEGCRHHVIPMAGGARGHPVVLGAWLRPQLETLAGDAGARHLLMSPGEAAQCCYLEVGDRAILRDVDTAPDRKSPTR
jgi:molybdenum cofactor cytidylyltransferase